MKSKIRNLEKGFYVKYIIATICLAVICAIAVTHSMYMDRKISDISKVYLSKISLQNAEIVSKQIHTNLQILDVIGRMVGSEEESNIAGIGRILRAEAENSGFISLGVVLNNGEMVFTPILSDSASGTDEAVYTGMEKSGANLLLNSDWEYIRKTAEGNADQSDSASRQIDGRTVNIYALPVFHGGVRIGALVALFDEKFLDNLFLPETLDESSCSYIADSNGNIIFRSESCDHNKMFGGVIQKLSDRWTMDGKSGAKLRADIHNGLRDTVEYNNDGTGIYISYVPVDFHGWYLVTLTSTTIAEVQSKRIYDDIFPVFIYILFIILALAIYFIYIRNQSYKKLERKIHLESINDESYRIIMEQTDDIIFEYDTMDKTYYHTANFRKNFGYEPTKTGFLGSLEYDYVHPDDVIGFVEMYEKMKQNRGLSEAEVRIVNSEGEYLWTRVYMLGVFDKDGRLARVIGKIVNIDEKKKELQILKEKAVTDSATGVYNKQTTEELIKAFLTGEGKFGKHAVLIIDIDDFKEINDIYGHRVGDAVISALGTELNHIFRASDIKGRIGGDEFMILMKDIEGEGIDFIIEKAKAICQLFGNYKLDENKQIDFSASIGIAFYDMDGETYEELYEAADRALYECKHTQKGTYAFCMNTDARTSSR